MVVGFFILLQKERQNMNQVGNLFFKVSYIFKLGFYFFWQYVEISYDFGFNFFFVDYLEFFIVVQGIGG